MALVEQLQPQGIACFRLQFPKAMEANEYANTVQPAHKSLGLVISKAQYLGEGDAPVITSLNDQTIVLDEMDLQVNREIRAQAGALSRSVNTAAKEKIAAKPLPDPVMSNDPQPLPSLAAIAAEKMTEPADAPLSEGGDQISHH